MRSSTRATMARYLEQLQSRRNEVSHLHDSADALRLLDAEIRRVESSIAKPPSDAVVATSRGLGFAA